MNCIETRKNIESLIDGELDGAFKESIERHLLICASCCEVKQEMSSLSSLLRTSRIPSPSELDRRVIESFRSRQKPAVAWWRGLIFGGFVMPKPVFAMLLILAVAGAWLAFQIGKLNSTTISIISPSVASNEIPVPTSSEPKIQTVVVEVPVIKEKIITRTIYVREPKINKTEKVKAPADSKLDILPSVNSVAENGYFTAVNLKGFEPAAEMSAKIIKEEKKDEE
ncbi:MAG TPA: zf-HC2 domain-containing protein [Pyrinomonadaceae bacterium]|nr:zf-HC2 domain-containing protein [Pyrinomonadaceae bacterium]